MISPSEFINKWDTSFTEIADFQEEIVNALFVSKMTKDFLIQAGLPESAAPYLCFHSTSKGGATKVNERFGLNESRFLPYIYIGLTAYGDPVCIKENQDSIVYLDHECDYKEIFINSTIYQLAEYLLIYNDFIDKIIEVNGVDAYLDSNAPEDIYLDMTNRLLEVDAPALDIGSFWNEELNPYKDN